jgi:hypothetical protein
MLQMRWKSKNPPTIFLALYEWRVLYAQYRNTSANNTDKLIGYQ